MCSTTSLQRPDRLLDRFGAAIYDPFLSRGERRGMTARRRELLAEASGRVLEIGAGTGLNVEHYPDDLDELVLTEPVGPMATRLGLRVAATGRDARVVWAPAEDLPFPDASFDTVVSTMVLCTVEDVQRTLAEIRRVLAPGGKLLFIEHVRSESKRLGRWQDRLAGPWRAFAAGCNTNRDTVAELQRGGLRLGSTSRDEWRGMPAVVRPLVRGSATA